jgi:hypothetical protein
MPFCEKCGTSINADSNFCRNCGAPQNAQPKDLHLQPPPNDDNSMKRSSDSYAFQQPLVDNRDEQNREFIIAYRSKRFGGKEYFTGILTTLQIAFVPMTNDMIKEVTNISRQQAKTKNAASITVYPYQQMYLNVSPSAILSQTSGSFSVPNSSIREINLKLVNVASDGYADFQEYEIQIFTDLQKLTFNMTKRDEYVSRLKQFCKEKIRTS